MMQIISMVVVCLVVIAALAAVWIDARNDPN